MDADLIDRNVARGVPLPSDQERWDKGRTAGR